MNTDVLASVYNRLPPIAQRAIERTDIYDALIDIRREEHYADQFIPLEICISGATFEVIVPEWGDDSYWIEHDPYNDEICHEPPMSRRFVDQINKGDVVWDMGSHYGYYASIAAQLNDNPENVHIFEMGEEKNWLISQMNQRLFDGKINQVHKRVAESTTDDSIAGDDYAVEHSAPDLVKMDIEGAEAPAIYGMQDIIEDDRPTLLIEMHPNKMYHHFRSNDESLLKKLNDWYSDVQVCDRFRNYTGQWDSDWRSQATNIHQLAAEAQLESYEETIGYIDPDSYAVVATN